MPDQIELYIDGKWETMYKQEATELDRVSYKLNVKRRRELAALGRDFTLEVVVRKEEDHAGQTIKAE